MGKKRAAANGYDGPEARPATTTAALSPTAGRPSSLLDTWVIYCGDDLERLAKLPEK